MSGHKFYQWRSVLHYLTHIHQSKKKTEDGDNIPSYNWSASTMNWWFGMWCFSISNRLMHYWVGMMSLAVFSNFCFSDLFFPLLTTRLFSFETEVAQAYTGDSHSRARCTHYTLHTYRVFTYNVYCVSCHIYIRHVIYS